MTLEEAAKSGEKILGREFKAGWFARRGKVVKGI
jgi:hypothetical protein